MGSDLSLRTFVEYGRCATEQRRVPQIQILTFELFFMRRHHHILSRDHTFPCHKAASATSLADGNCTIELDRGICTSEVERGNGTSELASELEQRIDTKSRTQQDTDKGIRTKAHLHLISSHDSPKTKLQA